MHQDEESFSYWVAFLGLSPRPSALRRKKIVRKQECEEHVRGKNHVKFDASNEPTPFQICVRYIYRTRTILMGLSNSFISYTKHPVPRQRIIRKNQAFGQVVVSLALLLIVYSRLQQTSEFYAKRRTSELKITTRKLPFSSPKHWGKRRSLHPNYGGLHINFLAHGEKRRIRKNLHAISGHVHKHGDLGNDDLFADEYFAFDDDYVRADQFRPQEMECQRVSWHKLYNPNCNDIHDIRLIEGKNRFLASGAYRNVYEVDVNGVTLILKLLDKERNFGLDMYESIRIDALVMERLTSSPRIVDIYGHCGTTVLTEYLPGEMESYIVPTSGYTQQLNDKDAVNPRNSLTTDEMLLLALQMSEAIADLHGFEDGVIVHDDIQLAQFLKTPDGILKLNDFNRAEVMLFDEDQSRYCGYKNGKGGGNYRAPEEYADGLLNEKIDVWSMGNNIYALLTGLWPFYEYEDDVPMHLKVANGETSFIDPRYKTRSSIEGNLVKVLEKCWEFNVDDRVDIFEVVAFLNEGK